VGAARCAPGTTRVDSLPAWLPWFLLIVLALALLLPAAWYFMRGGPRPERGYAVDEAAAPGRRAPDGDERPLGPGHRRVCPAAGGVGLMFVLSLL
jgi:hypothetical protein